MSRWAGLALALGQPGSDGMMSRLSTYLHPVAGRPLIWHAVAGLTAVRPLPARVLVLAGSEISPDLFQDLDAPVEVIRPGSDTAEALTEDAAALGERFLVVDGAAPLLRSVLQRLVESETGSSVELDAGAVAAAWIAPELLPSLVAESSGLHAVPLPTSGRVQSPEGLVVRDRLDLAGATRTIRDRVARRLMRAGATFVAPETVQVDVDVRIGRDTVVYPGVVLEGQTHIGEETVVGPGCRIIDSWIGSGVELKGWNYISHTSVRNRAILEPYVRRGFD